MSVFATYRDTTLIEASLLGIKLEANRLYEL